MRLTRSDLITAKVPRDSPQFACRSTAAVHCSWLMKRPVTRLLAIVVPWSRRNASLRAVTSRAYATANAYKPGGVVILGSHLPAMSWRYGNGLFSQRVQEGQGVSRCARPNGLCVRLSACVLSRLPQ